MKWVYDLCGAEPIIRDVPLYDAATIVKGELVMLGTTDPDSNADSGLAFVTAYSATEANVAVDALGVCQETLTTSSTRSIASVPTETTGPCLGKCIINPFAVYRAEHYTGTSNDVAITSTSTTTVTVASLQDDIDGYWAYFPLTADGVKGSLRMLDESASGSATMDSALNTTGTAADTICLISPPFEYAPMMTADALGFHSENADDTMNACTNIRIVQTLLDRDMGLEVMEQGTHYGINNLDLVKGGKGPKFYYDIVLKDHIFGAQE